MDSEMSDVEAYLLPTSILDKAAYVVRDEDTEFCNKSNLANSIAYINQEFELLGLSCVTHDGTRCTSDMLFFINRLYDLLTLYQKIMAVKGDLETRNHRLLCEIDHYQNTALRGKKLQEQTDRELNQEREKTRQLSMKYKQVCSSLKTEKEEVRRLTAVLQSRDIQHKHEQKKKEKEVHRLKERLHQLLADKVPDRKVGMDLMNVVSRRSEEGRRATWKTGPEKQEEEMYHILINNYEERHQELMQENGGLRDCLLSLQRELSTLVKHTTDLSVTSVLDVSSCQSS
uniref:Uncharacterized protein n=1 Tax=Arion vulgaris TaxID=1028688 RepID=A0A0B6ZWN3_9EUPU